VDAETKEVDPRTERMTFQPQHITRLDTGCYGIFVAVLLGFVVGASAASARALYRRFGFVEEGRRVKHYRRSTGELWDSIDMGLLL
jgi:ribosomal protein S18 acetylase RimI-like enzyme